MTHEPIRLLGSFDVITGTVETFLRGQSRFHLKFPERISAGLCIYPLGSPSWGNCGELIISKETAEIMNWSSVEPFFSSAKDTLLSRVMGNRSDWSERHPTRDDLEKKFDERAIELEEALAHYQEPVGKAPATSSQDLNINAPEILTSWLTSLRFPREQIESILLWAQGGIRNHQIRLNITREARYERMLKSLEKHLRDKGLWNPVVERSTHRKRDSEPRGERVGTRDRVKAVHKLLKDGKVKRTTAFKQMHIDPRTYNQYCEEVTGEEPIESYRD